MVSGAAAVGIRSGCCGSQVPACPIGVRMCVITVSFLKQGIFSPGSAQASEDLAAGCS